MIVSMDADIAAEAVDCPQWPHYLTGPAVSNARLLLLAELARRRRYSRVREAYPDVRIDVEDHGEEDGNCDF